MSTNYGKNNIRSIYTAKSVTEAVKAYNHNCEQCLYGCYNGDVCSSEIAFENVMKRPAFQAEMKNPAIRKLVAQMKEEP